MDILSIGALAVPASLAVISLLRGHSIEGITVGTRFLMPYRIPLDKHLCILGPTRGGKSSLVKAMIKELSQKYVVTALDWHGEYAGILPTLPTTAINIDLEKIPPKLLTEILGFGLGLNEPSMYMLYRIIRDGEYSSFNDLIRKIDNYLVNTRTEAEMKAAILRRLEYSAMNIGKGIVGIEALMESDAVVDLSDLTIIEEKRLVSSLILAALYMNYMRRGLIERRVRHVLIIEEAQNLLDVNGASYSIVDHVIMELAKYGLRTILVSNVVPKSLILKHCNIILFKINPGLLDNDVSLSRDLISKLSEISAEEAIVITGRGIVKIRPLRAPVLPTHVVIRRLNHAEDKAPTDDLTNVDMNVNNNDLRPKVTAHSVTGNNGDHGTNSNNDKALGNFDGNKGSPLGVNSDQSDESLFRRQVTELEREVINLRDKVNEIERILDVDEKLIEKILELDGKLKNNPHS